MEDPEIKSLADSLPYILESGLAKSTTVKSRLGEMVGLGVPAATDQYHPCRSVLCCHLFELRQGKHWGRYTTATHGIAWAHRIAGFVSPTEDPFVTLTAKGCARLLGKPISKSEPLTSPVVKALFDAYKTHATSSNLPAYRFLLITLVCYAGFLRIDELLTTRLSHVHLDKEFMTITLPKCKNDQQRAGNVVYIARTRSTYCPVTFVEEFLELAGLSLTDTEAHLLPRIIKIQRGYKAHRTLGISYTTARELYQKHVRAIYGVTRKYTLHRLRAGGQVKPPATGSMDAPSPSTGDGRHSKREMHISSFTLRVS